MALILHTNGDNRNAFKAKIVAGYLGVELKVLEDFQFGGCKETPAFLRLYSIEKIPVLETPDGPLFESNAIARYVARLKHNTLMGSTSYEKALVDQWIDFASSEIDNRLGPWTAPRPGFEHDSAEVADHVKTKVENAAISNLKRALSFLNGFLSSHTFLVGNSITLADVILTCTLIGVFKTVLSSELTPGFPHVERYFCTMVNEPQVKRVVGEVKQGERKLKVPDPSLTKSETPASVPKGKGAPKPKSAPKPKEAPKPQVAPKQNGVEPEEEEAPKPKAKNPLDLLPPSPFVIDNWKRLYSNTKAKDFSDVAIKGFWEMFDPEGWSFWFADYKYNEENDKTYVTMNKVGGFFQRLDFIRKYAFGKMLIVGEESPYKIKGVWLFRGQEIPKMVIDECYDAELYTWTKADLSSEEQKSRINAYFEEPDFIDGDKLLEAKCFK